MIRRSVMFYVMLATLCFGLAAGFAIHKFGWYPHRTIISVLHQCGLVRALPDYTTWAIGIREGTSPFMLSDPAGITNPVLTAESVDDIDALFVADPFILPVDGEYHMFFEVMNRETQQGDIGYAVSQDALQWEYGGIVLDEDFHLSYPCTFEWKGEYYMIPESGDDFSVRLYKATSFPAEWKYEGTLLSGHPYVDPSILRYDNKWWLFIATQEGDYLNIYYSDELMGKWKPHLMNPVVKQDKSRARPGGRILNNNGKIYRFAQDGDGEYGKQVSAFEITELTVDSYGERPVPENPVVAPGSKGWNGGGMHHVDHVKVGDSWIVVVDGRSG